ncbi:MAG: hypothetical protein RQ866_05835 [Bacteroidales bacterium]|nr:hypothetical protein [Bacteroidales bacterium]
MKNWKITPLVGLVIVSMVISSCSMMLNSHTTDITIASEQTDVAILVDDTVLLPLPVTIEVLRSRRALPLVIAYDTLLHSFDLKRTISPTYIFGNPVALYGLGYLIDLAYTKMFAYPKEIWFDFASQNVVQYGFPFQQGATYLEAGYVAPSIIRYNKGTQQYGFWGITGFSFGSSFVYNNNQFVYFHVGALQGFSSAITEGIRLESLVSTFLKTGIGGRFLHNIEYRLGLSINNYYMRDGFSNNMWNNSYSYTVGFFTDLAYYFRNNIFIGFTYQPSIFDFQTAEFQYSAMRYLQLGYRWTIFHPQKQDALPLFLNVR